MLNFGPRQIVTLEVTAWILKLIAEGDSKPILISQGSVRSLYKILSNLPGFDGLCVSAHDFWKLLVGETNVVDKDNLVDEFLQPFLKVCSPFMEFNYH